MPASLSVADLPNGVRQLTLSNPSRKNALDAGVLEALAKAVEDGGSVRAWLVRGEGPGAFSSGYDLSSLETVPAGARLPDERIGEVFDLLMHHPAPSVALVLGPAFGAGCELALACDFRVGDASATFCMPPAKVGVVYAQKGLSRVIERVGEAKARYMCLTGRRIVGAEAHRFGLLDLLSADLIAAETDALALCTELAQNAPLAVSGMKKGFELLARGGGTDAERADYEAKRRASFNSEDAKEGRSAILEKRPPKFRGA
jgi:enoyl-CoA hydratase/carnithine racemase